MEGHDRRGGPGELVTPAGTGFDPSFDPSHLSRETLAALGREQMLYAFLLTRVGLGHVHLRYGEQEREEIAILEWMGASPVYTQRMQRALGFAGTAMDTIFKGLQLDVGFCHQYMDVGYRLHDARHGEFWLKSCGALLDVEPMGEPFVVSMCHHIEDPTFDATAVATNPRARIRPIHRPPRQPAGRVPHCHWTATIDPGAEPVTEIELTRRVRRSRLASVETPVPAAREPGGWPDYSGEFDPDFQLEDLGQRALMAATAELTIQSHLLMRSMTLAVGDRHGREAARALALDAWEGASWVASERLRSLLGLDGTALADVLRVLQLHPAFPRGYAPLTIDAGRDPARLELSADSPALAEGDEASWLALLAAGDDRVLEAVVHGADPRARVERTGDLEWDLILDDAAPRAVEPDAVAIARVGAVAGFEFERRRPVRA